MDGIRLKTEDIEQTEHTQARAAYLDLALASGDGYFAIDALGAIACAYGLERVAEAADMSLEELVDCFDSRHVLDVVRFLKIASIVGIAICAMKND